MNTQDRNANALASLAQQEGIDFQNEEMGLRALGVGSGMLGTAGNLNTQAGGLYGEAGQNIINQANPLINAKSGGGLGGLASKLGGSSAGGSGAGSGSGGLLAGLLGNYLGGAGGGAVDTGVWDVGTAALSA